MTDTSKPASLATDHIVAQTYQPIIRGYFAVAAIYYAIMTPIHFWDLKATELATMVSVSTAACLVALAAFYALSRPLGIGKLEAITGIVNLLVITNVLVALDIDYRQEKLSYFIMMTMIFALASVSIRQALLSIVITLGALLVELIHHEPESLVAYGYIAFGAAMSTIAIAYYLRRAIGISVNAKQEADNARRDAEVRLSEAEDLGEAMRRQSLSDSLTGLPNRRAFFETLRSRKRSEAQTQNDSWLILLDLDGFKAINDNYGHIMGDGLLKAVAKRLERYCGSRAHVSRMGGDEFNVILPECDNAEDAENWCQKLLDRIAEVYQIEDRRIQISGSIGCYPIIREETDTQMIRKADFALLHAKRHGKNRVVVFSDEHARDAAEHFKIEQALRIADFDAEIELLFQPQFDFSQNKVVCAEALARWNSPIIGLVGPNRFIKIAEESGLIDRITVAVLDKAIAALKGWQTPIPLSINLSAQDLISDQIIDDVVHRVKQSGLDPILLEFEVTETAMMVDMEKATANLVRLSELGHPVALDDFGTGYSNFSYLRNLPIRKLKVDRSFMENLSDPMTEKILHSLAGMAKTLDVHCLLEGVENELELVMAKRVGAQSVQGYLFGTPMKSDELQTWIETNRDGAPSAKTEEVAAR